MSSGWFDGLVASLRHGATRRGALGVLAGTVGLGLQAAPAKKRKKTCRTCCRANGNPCTKKNASCKPGYCPRFTITASWDSDRNHDTYLFVPNAEGASLPSPFIDKLCNSCGRGPYPFACVNQDAEGPGDEVTRIFRLLPGRYEYWIELSPDTPPGDVKVRLRDKGNIVFTATSPANSDDSAVGSWHVFDLDGRDGRFDKVDEFIQDNLPRAAHVPNTFVCPP
jgi:hypothetical protein